MTGEPFPQPKMIERLRQICQSDERLEAAMLYGSFTRGEGDLYSDIDCLLYFHDEILPAIDPREWASQLGPLALIYRNEFGHHTAIYHNLVRVEYHFDPASGMSRLENLRGIVAFPSLESTLLLDRHGRLALNLQPLLGPVPAHDTPQDVQYLVHSLFNWVLFGWNVLQRGEAARALEILNALHGHLANMARLLDGGRERWINSLSGLENELSPEGYRRYAACTAALDPQELEQAYRNAWDWGRQMAGRLAQRYPLEIPEDLQAKLDDYLRGKPPWV